MGFHPKAQIMAGSTQQGYAVSVQPLGQSNWVIKNAQGVNLLVIVDDGDGLGRYSVIDAISGKGMWITATKIDELAQEIHMALEELDELGLIV